MSILEGRARDGKDNATTVVDWLSLPAHTRLRLTQATLNPPSTNVYHQKHKRNAMLLFASSIDRIMNIQKERGLGAR